MIKKILILFICWELIFAMPLSAQTVVEGGIPGGVVPENAAVLEDVQESLELLPGYITINFKEADIKVVLNYLSDVSGVDIVPAPDVSGPITIKLTNKPWQTALDIIVRNYGFAYEKEKGIIRVVTVESLKLEELATEVVQLHYSTAAAVVPSIQDMLTSRGKITADTRTNLLVITDVPANIYKIKQVILKLDKRTVQVMIEAKIIETTLGDDERMGIDWNLVISARGAVRPTTFPFTVRGNLPRLTTAWWNRFMPRPMGNTTSQITDTGGNTAVLTTVVSDFPIGMAEMDQGDASPFPLMMAEDFGFGTLDFSQFSAVLEYLDDRSDTHILSNPRITTLNNKQAKMFVGKVFNYISEIEEKEEAGGSEKFTYTMEKEEIGIRLLVTPHVNERNEIEVVLKPEIKDVVSFQQITQYFALPVFSTREAETQVMVNDGDTIFIGGLIREKTIKREDKFPVLGDMFGDLPFLGSLVKYSSETTEKTELVFFLTVHIMKDLKETNMRILKEFPMAEAYVSLDDENVNVSSEAEVVNETRIQLEGTEGQQTVPVVTAPEAKAVKQKNPGPWIDFRKKKK